jgi:hypothetical protein
MKSWRSCYSPRRRKVGALLAIHPGASFTDTSTPLLLPRLPHPRHLTLFAKSNTRVSIESFRFSTR